MLIQLCQRVNILHKVKGTGNSVLKVQVKRDKEVLQTWIKDRVTNYLDRYLSAQVNR